MSYGALLTYPDGTPFYIQDATPISLIYKRDFNYSPYEITTVPLEPNTGLPYLYFIRFNEPYAWAYQIPGVGEHTGKHTLKMGVYYGDSLSGRLYCFGLHYQTPPKWGVAIWDAQGRCILTNETIVLRGIKTTGASGPTGTAKYLNETLTGRKAIVPGITGMVIYKAWMGGAPITLPEPHATACYWQDGNTRVVSVPVPRSSQIAASVSSTSGNYYRPAYIDCDLYD